MAVTIVFEQAYGNRALEPAVEPMTTDTIFDMASLTKVLVTTTAILQLYEQGKLELRRAGGQIPAGLRRRTISSPLRFASCSPTTPASPKTSLSPTPGASPHPTKPKPSAAPLAATPYGPPGLTFKYSDINFITLGALVEQLSGQPLDTYAREQIFHPLSMNHTVYHPFAKTCGPASRTGSAISPGPKPTGHILVSCIDDTWSPNATIPSTAPTTRDNEGTPATNPNFDLLLRGTVHDPTTRRMGGVAGHARRLLHRRRRQQILRRPPRKTPL